MAANEVHVSLRHPDGTVTSRVYLATDLIELDDAAVVTASELVSGAFLLDGSEVLATGEGAIGGHEITPPA
jgi:hypothetical protein